MIVQFMMEFRAGTGGDEAALFAGDLYRMYQRHCEGKGWRWQVGSMPTKEQRVVSKK